MSNNEFNNMNGMNENNPAENNGCTYSNSYVGQNGTSTYHYNYDPYTGQPNAQQAAPEDSGKRSRKQKAPKQKKASSGMTGRMVALGLSCALVGGLVGGGGVLAGNYLMSTSSGAKSTAVSNVTSLVESSRTSVLETSYVDTTGQEMTASQIYAANVNSCVGITANITYNIWGYTTTAAASGSGFVLTSDGYIVTNYHVVEDSDSDGLTVTMYDGTSYAATLVGYDSDNDVAVLKIDATDLTPVVLGDSDSLSVGDEVVAIGNPLGELTFSLTQGVVSALNREVTLSIGTMNLIQTDCAINSGNSGGPLFNSYGEVVGITNAKYSSSSSSSTASIDNIGFAIPTSTFRSIVESIIENGYVVKPYIGVQLKDYSYTAADGSTTSGALIYSVESGTSAETAGLTRGDLITAINGEAITTTSEATAIVDQYQPGDVITITIDRNGESMDVDITLGERTQDALEDSSSSTTQQSQQSGQNGQSSQGGQSGQYNPYGNGQSGSNYPFGNGMG